MIEIRMMRDTLRTKEYFDEFIIQQVKISEKYEKNLNDGTITGDRILLVKYALLQVRLGIIIAKYSMGESITDLKDEFEAMTDLFAEAWDYESSYVDNLRYASLAYLLNVDSASVDKIRNRLIATKFYDYLIDYILIGEDNALDKQMLAFPKSYTKLASIIEERNVEILSHYLRYWYRGNCGCAWYDTHKITKFNLYYGYWCFEAAALAKRLGLDSELLKNKRYYPYDLACYEE